MSGATTKAARSVRADWRAVAERLARAIPRERLHPEVTAWADGAPPRKVWHVAVSGGADSVALLLLVWAHWPERRRRLRAIHFDHRLRGKASQADVVFCRRLCAALKVKLTVGRWASAVRPLRPSEAEARAARMAFFERHATALWTGHHLDDVAETMLMRLARGSGAGGLSAPRPVQVFGRERVHVRPLLPLRKAEIARALAAAGGHWREDATNAGEAYFRNRIRAAVLPAWVEASQRDAMGGAARSRELLAEDDFALETWLAELDPIERDGSLRLDRLAGKPRALARRALHRWLLAQRRSVDVSRQAFDLLLDAVMRGLATRQSLGTGVFAVIRRGRLRFLAGKPHAKF